MSIKIGISGFGRISRVVIRAAMNDPEIEIAGINVRNADKDYMVYMLKYDSIFGRFPRTLDTYEDGLVIDGKKVPVYSESEAINIPWASCGAEYIVEGTGAYVTTEKATDHLKAGAKKVVISAPATGDIKTVVYNVNQDILDGTETVISGASCTTNCLAPMAKVLNDKYGVQKGFMTTIHAYTNDQNTLDAPHGKGDLRRGRAAAASIVPNSTGAAKAIGLVIPELNGKLDGGAQRVPVITGSLTELVCTLNTKVTAAEINEAMKAAANESFGYTEDEIVSADVIGISYGSLFDATQTKVMEVNGEQLVKVAAWYDNEMSYTNQLIRTLGYFASLIK